MHRLVYETGKIKIIAHCRNEEEKMISFGSCFDTNFAGKLPSIFRRRDTKVFCSKRIADSLNTVEKVECTGPVKYTDLKKFLPTVFDIQYISKINNMCFVKKNKGLIIRLASEVIGEEEALRILEDK